MRTPLPIAILLLLTTLTLAQEKSAPAETPPPPPKFDIYGDALPPGAIARFGTQRLRHARHAWAAAISRDNTLLATADGTGRVLAWEIKTGKRLWASEPNPNYQAVQQVAYSPDGKLLAAAIPYKGVTLFRAATGEVVHNFNPANRAIQSLAFTSDSTRLLIGGMGVQVLDVTGGQLIHEFKYEKTAVHVAWIATHGETLAAAGATGEIIFFDLAERKEKARISQPAKPLASMAISPDGRELLIGDRGQTEYVRGADGNTITGRVQHPPGVSVIDIESKQQKQRIADVSFVRYVDGGKRIVASVPVTGTADWKIATIDPANWKVTATDIIAGHRFAVSDDGTILAALISGEGVELKSLPDGKPLLPELPGPNSAASCIAVSPDGRFIVTGHGSTSVPAPRTNSAYVWDAITSKFIARLADGKVSLSDAAFSPDSKWLIAACQDGTLRLFESGTWKQLHEWPAERFVGVRVNPTTGQPYANQVAAIRDIAFIGRTRLALAGVDNGVTVIDLPQGSVISRFTPERTRASIARRIASSRNGRSLPIIASQPGAVNISGMPVENAGLYDPVSSQLLSELPTASQFIQCASTSPSGLLLAAGSHSASVQLFEVSTGQLVRSFRSGAVQHAVYGVAISPDHRLLATAGSRDRTVRVWSIADSSEVGTFTGHEGDVYAVRFSADGRTLISGGADCVAIQWDLAPVYAKLPAPKIADSDEEWSKAWDELAGKDPAAAWTAQAMFLAAGPAGAKAVADRADTQRVDRKQIARWIAQLDAEKFEARDAAHQSLASWGDAILEDLAQAIKAKPTIEQRWRLEELVVEASKPAVQSHKHQRLMRAAWLLEAIGGDEAKRGLAKLASGEPTARPTKEAKAALDHLAERGE